MSLDNYTKNKKNMKSVITVQEKENRVWVLMTPTSVETFCQEHPTTAIKRW